MHGHEGRDSGRSAPLHMDAEAFRRAGHALVDTLAEFLASVPARPVTRGETPAQVQAALGADAPLPERGSDAEVLLREAAALLFEHSLLNGHPRFFGYITSSPAPIGMLGDLLAVGGQSERGRLDALAHGHRARGADGALDRRADRLSRGLRRPVRQRRQHGEHGGLLRRARGRRGLGRARARAWRHRRRGGCACTPPPRRTPGSRRRRTSPGSAPTPSAGLRRTRSCAWTWPRCAARSRRTAPPASCR